MWRACRRLRGARPVGMQWTDEGIVLGAKRHGEANAILDVMTRDHGRHLGMVRGGFGSRMKPILQPGNGVSVTWRARLDEHLGQLHRRAAALTRLRLLRRAACDLRRRPSCRVDAASARARSASRRFTRRSTFCSTVLPMRRRRAPMVVRFELQVLTELGFGLDLAECAATGTTRRIDLRFAEIRTRRLARGRHALRRPHVAPSCFPRRCRRAARGGGACRRICADRIFLGALCAGAARAWAD